MERHELGDKEKLRLVIRAKLKLADDVVESLVADPSQKELDDPCPTCGQASLVCCHCELGGSLDFHDHFVHICTDPQCDYALHLEERTALGDEQADDQLCRFCQRDLLLSTPESSLDDDPVRASTSKRH